MKEEKILSLNPPQLDIAIGEKVMGWHRRKGNRSKDCTYSWFDGSNSFQACQCQFKPSVDISRAWEMQQRIADKGLGERYGEQLALLVVSPSQGSKDFPLAHASPEVRCRAALLAVLGKEGR